MASETLSPSVASRVMSEIRDIVRHPVEGIEYEEEDNSITEIHATICGPEGTPYHNGKFRMKLILGEDYPASPPKGYFLTRIYHPNVSLTGDICVNTLKKDWTPETTLKHVFQVIRCLLIVPFPESSLNDEAGKLFMESYEEFSRRARIMTDVHALEKENTESLNDDASVTSSGLKDGGSINKAKEAKKKNLKRL